mmetsp:Transcript_14274/g.29796  ORF Transcript_14274/g.29796 Transcript_14274/m.29796 type:complete len:278 (-) Transcript_14274:162-995(-)
MYMDHGESIYRIIPPKPEIVPRPPMHKSKHSHAKPPSCTTFGPLGTTCPRVANVAGDLQDKPVPNQSHATFGKARGDYAEDPGDYLKKCAKSGGKVLTLAQLKREHPEVLAPKELKPQTRVGPPTKEERPVMNLVTSKNFIVANAVEVILAAPKKLPQGSRDYLKKEDYGKVPKYLSHIKKDIDAEYSYIRALQEAREQEEAARMRPLEEEERKDLIEGLKTKWEQVNTAYQAGTHITKLDTMGKMKRKERHEAELSQIEKDIEKLSKKQIIVSADG